MDQPKKFVLVINTTNHNFNAEDGSLETEVSQILDWIGQRVEAGEESGMITDSKGNQVGSFRFAFTSNPIPL